MSNVNNDVLTFSGVFVGEDVADGGVVDDGGDVDGVVGGAYKHMVMNVNKLKQKAKDCKQARVGVHLQSTQKKEELVRLLTPNFVKCRLEKV